MDIVRTKAYGVVWRRVSTASSPASSAVIEPEARGFLGLAGFRILQGVKIGSGLSELTRGWVLSVCAEPASGVTAMKRASPIDTHT
jgi:hypothetical protein